MPTSFCRDGVCSHESDVTSISCYPFSQITITVFAGNVLGNGSLSNSITLGQFWYYNTIHRCRKGGCITDFLSSAS